MKLSTRSLSLVAGALAASLGGAGLLYAQLEGSDRGVPPVESASTIEVTGIEVDVTAKTADAARYEGWKQAQAKGWRALWAKTNNRPQSEAPALNEAALNAMVASIVIEREQIGPTRYIARLGILFDRARSSQLLGLSSFVRRSHPVLVIPVMLTGSSAQSFESRNEWQRAWARFRTVNSPIDYVRPVGSGIDPLLLNIAQTRRPGRAQWRTLIDQYGASDIVVPEVRLKRSYPGGPAIGEFVARHGPDNRILARFVLRAGNSASIPAMLDEGVRRLDIAYTNAFASGFLSADPSLEVVEPELIEDVAEQIETGAPTSAAPATFPAGGATSFSLQYATPAADAVTQAEISVSRVPGVTSALTTSLAIGGTSVMRATFSGDAEAFAAALRAQGWTVEVAGGNTLRISR